jgi:hypothetical protein
MWLAGRGPPPPTLNCDALSNPDQIGRDTSYFIYFRLPDARAWEWFNSSFLLSTLWDFIGEFLGQDVSTWVIRPERASWTDRYLLRDHGTLQIHQALKPERAGATRTRFVVTASPT